MKTAFVLAALLASSTALPGFAAAAAAEPYVPDVIELDGSDSLAFPPDASLTITGGGTIEFWVGADWQEDPGYDPVVLSNAGAEGPLYLIALLRGRDGLAFAAGDRVEELPYDFSDGTMHFVAVIDFGDATEVMVDGYLVGTLDFGFADLPSSGLWIGSADDTGSMFMGAIAALRIWDIPVAPEDLIDFSQADIDGDPPHPDLDFLVALSGFRTRDVFLSEIAEVEVFIDEDSP